MKVLFLTHAFNALAQRLFVELADAGHEVAIEFDVNDAVTREAVALAKPDVIVAPFLKRAIAEDVWSRTPCLIVHPGPPGDRGPSSLDWAIQEGEREWGVTVLQAVAEMDAGPVWAHAKFPMRLAPKSSLYRREVTEAAVVCVREALDKLARGARPCPASDLGAVASGRSRRRDEAGGPRHRLGARRHADSAAQDPRRRWLPRRARQGAGTRCVSLRRA